MTAAFIHWLAVKSFLRKLIHDVPLLYRQELRNAHTAVAIAERLRDGWTPEALAMGQCADEGEAYGSKRYEELLKVVQEVQREFGLQPATNGKDVT